jgi:hypothetical protein
MPDRSVLTPGGPRPRSRVHRLALGHRLEIRDGRLRELDSGGNLFADHGPVDDAEIKPSPDQVADNKGPPRR